MRKLVVGVILILSGCMSAEEQAAQQQRVAMADIERCRSMGATTEAQFFSCRMAIYQQRTTQSEANGRQMQALGAALLANPQPQQTAFPRSVTCRSIPEGIMVRTACS